MRKKQERVIFGNYLKERSILLAAYAMIVLIFLALAALYGYDKIVINMLYAVVVTAFIAAFAGIIGYIHYRNKCLKLYDALSKRGESAYHLPEARVLSEKLYTEMVLTAEEDKRRTVSESDEKSRDMADYYTMWIHQIKTPISALRLVLQGMPDMEAVENTAAVENADAVQNMDIVENTAAGRDTAIRQASEELFKIERYAEMALYYARLDDMSSDMLFQEYDIGGIIKLAVKKYALLFIGSRLSFDLEYFECRTVTDEKWLSFAIEQILSNALKYTAEGGIRIYGVDESGERHRGRVNHIVIEDTGMGICESDLPRIFERGFTGYNGRMNRKSTGIGLYLCKQIMDRLSHKIEVRSAVNVGTKVMLSFGRNNDNVTKV